MPIVLLFALTRFEREGCSTGQVTTDLIRMSREVDAADRNPFNEDTGIFRNARNNLHDTVPGLP